jgi:phosphoenolpyruvate-protein phosphotransferase (PTS system enzyme I)
MKTLNGIGASSGFGHAKAFRLLPPTFTPQEARSFEATKELQQLATAMEQTTADLIRLESITTTNISAAAADVFAAHQLILLDPSLADFIQDLIQQGHQALYAVLQAQTFFKDMFASMDDAYMQERAQDIVDVTNRIATYVSGQQPTDLALIDSPVILIARDLGPSDTAVLNKQFVRGFVTEIGGRTSHTAIIARSLEIPAVVGAVHALASVKDHDIVLIDGTSGEVVIAPDVETLSRFDQAAAVYANEQVILQAYASKETITKDGVRVELASNIGSLEELHKAVERRSDGVGLFRTELLFLAATSAPTEDAQASIYERAVRLAHPNKIIFRTLDIGGDKVIPYMDLPKEENPFLGVRGIRLNLQEQVLLQTQLRALLRASAAGAIRIMFPMIATLEELLDAKAMVAAAKSQLHAEGIAVGEVEIGIMIEIPAAAVAADVFAPHVDFFSIGTNDLIQYTMAADRMNEGVKHLYQPYHPAVIRLISMTIDAAHRHGKWTGMCGSMAGELQATKLLLALGLDEFSVSIASLLELRAHIATIEVSKLAPLKTAILQATSEQELMQLFQQD